jgi:5,10-methenyltetrahydromethanopterin hydrogenase
VQEIKEELREESLVAAFPDREAAVAAATALDAAGIPPDHVGVVAGNVRQAREAAGSFSAAGALSGAVLGAVIAVIFVVAGGDAMRQNLVAIVLGAPALIFAFAAIGALAGRARLFQRDEYERFENAVDRGEALVTVSGPPELLSKARRILEEHGALRFRREATGEAI